MSIELREARDEDVPGLVELIRSAFAEYRDQLDPPSSAERKTESVLREELADGGAFVVTEDETLVACVLWHPHDSDIYLDRLSVHPNQRGAGLARRLVAAVEAVARERGAGGLRLSVRLVLTRQQAFYERLGFRFDSYGTHDGYAEPTYMKMRKPL